MKNDLALALVWIATLILAWKLGQAQELLRELDTPEVQPASRASAGREHGKAGPSGVSSSSSIFDREDESVWAGPEPGALRLVEEPNVQLTVERPGPRLVKP
jgi:hypothetical protein